MQCYNNIAVILKALGGQHGTEQLFVLPTQSSLVRISVSLSLLMIIYIEPQIPVGELAIVTCLVSAH